MVKAPILSPTPPSSSSLSPTNEDDQQHIDNTTNTIPSDSINPIRSTALTSSKVDDSQNEKLKRVKIRLDDLMMDDTELQTIESVTGDDSADGVDQSEQYPSAQDSDLPEVDQNENISSDTNNSSAVLTKTSTLDESGASPPGCLQGNGNGGAPLTTLTPTAVLQPQMISPIAIGMVHPTAQPPPAAVQQIPQIQATPQPVTISQPPPPPQQQQQQQQQGPPHHHIFPGYVISIPPPGPPGSTAVTSAWPLVEAPIYLDANGEPRHYCPAHPQGPAPPPREHCVLLQLDAGVSLPLQIAGKRKVFRGPTTVQMVSQNRPPPIPVPVQVPQGQVMQQYVNESGTLTHVVLSQYPQLHTGQGGVPHIHAPFITGNGTTPHFYSLQGGYPGGAAPHFHQIPGGHLQPQPMSHSPHSPSPPSNYHKDERTQRQHTKLLRKLDQKREISSAMSTPAHSPSPRKNDLNGLRRGSRNGASSVGTSEDGEESSSVPDEEDDSQAIIDQLSAVQKPEVTDITSRSAIIRWEAPPLSEGITLNSRGLRYFVLLSDLDKEGKYKVIYRGESYVCKIQDLRPGQEYLLCLQVHFDKLAGTVSEATVFKTPPCEPDQPLPPKLSNYRTKNSLQLRWMAPLDNGSHITNYILESDDGKGKEFTEVTRTKGKQYTVTKLQPSTHYSFRLCAVNEVGPSLFSDIIIHSTLGYPPQTPKPPILQSATSSSLRVSWERRNNDEEFVLQMADAEYGFMNRYNGLDTQYECKDLKRATAYKFRLRADNDAGSSAYCNDVTYKTLPERPGRPAKPQIKGKIHGTSFKARWDPPNDRGGAEIKKYFLEISCGAKFERIYTGSEAEAICDRLSPGTTYQIKVSCEGPGGMSDYSDIFTVTTEAIVPGAPEPPFCSSPPGPYGAMLRWEKPDYNGGAPVLKYDLQLNGLNHDDTIVYHGKESYCVIKDLSPGEEYQAHVRAVNRIGAGAWSEALKFCAGAAPPYAPESLEVLIRSATHLTVSWKESITNGAPITAYRLESSTTEDSNDCFHACYQGLQISTDLRNLIPFTPYYFRVCAINTAGTSLYSTVISTQTPAAVPSVPHVETYEITADEVKLVWSEPEANGSKILYYVIEFGDQVIRTDGNCTEYKIGQLASETSYKFKVQAVNEIGAGQFSASIKLTTLPPPPEPPKLECTGSGHNYIKLKWGEGRNLDYTTYYVEMYNGRAKEFQVVYKGTSFMCKVNKLQEQQEYRFRIYAETDKAGNGDYSPEYVFSTSATLPSNIKAPRVMEFAPSSTSSAAIASSNSGMNSSAGIPCLRYSSSDLTIEWQHSKNTFPDPIEYVLQCSCGKDPDYKEIYRGPETHYTIDNLESGSIYLFRVCPIRITSTGDELLGTYTNPLRYQVPLYRKSIDTTDAALPSSTNFIHHHHHRSVGIITGGGGLLSTSDPLSTIDDNNSHHQHHHQHHLIRTSTNNNNNSSHNTSGNSLKRITGKLTSIYSNRRRFSDQEKAILWMIFFIVATIGFAVLVRMFTR